MNNEMKMGVIPDCDLCKDGTPAEYDSRLPGYGWGYVCADHWRRYGPGQLGIGHAQRLVLRGEA